MSDVQPLRIFFASAADVLVGGGGNGEGNIATDVLTRLAERGHEVTACVGTNRMPPIPGVSVHELDRASDLLTLQPLLRARRALRVFESCGGERAFDVVHCLFPNWAPGISAHAYGPLPVVIGPVVTEWDMAPRWWPIGFTLRRLLAPVIAARRRRNRRCAAAIAVVGPAARASVGASRARIVEIPFGLRSASFPEAPLPAGDAFVVLYLGRLQESRGVLDLMAAARLAAPDVPGLRIVFIGDGVERDRLERLARQIEPAGTVEVRRPIPRADVARALSASSACCMPSWGEPFGMAVLEAMSVGRPVIATDAGALPELVVAGRGGVLVPPRDPAALAGAIRELAADPVTAAAMGHFNRLRVESDYDLDVVLDRVERMYRDSIAPVASPGARSGPTSDGTPDPGPQR